MVEPIAARISYERIALETLRRSLDSIWDDFSRLALALAQT